MSILLLNNAEGGTNGTTVSAANSGSGSGTAFDSVSVNGSSTLTFDNTHAYGTLAYKNVIAASSFLTREWNTAFGTQTDYWVRFYYYATTLTNPRLLVYGRNGATNAWRLELNTSGNLILQNSASTTVYTSASAVAVNQWNRIEIHITHATGSTGSARVLLYNTADSTTADSDDTTSSLSLLTQATLIDFGQNSTAFGSVTWWDDNIGVATAGALGPLVANTVAPSVSGSAPSGSTLTAANGTWNGANQAFTYQWTSNGSNISAATSSTYVTQVGDVGNAIGCNVTCSNSTTTEAATASSSNTITVTSAGPAPSNTVAPAVTGTTTVGSVLTTDNGTWTDDGSPTFTYQWQRDVAGNGVFSNISSATSSTYTLVDADDGNKVRCNVKDTDSNGNTTAASNAVGLITEAAVPTISVAPVVSGTTTVGQSLSTTNGTWTGMGGSVATFAYQWQRDNTGGGVYSNIASATSSSYTLVDADDACNIKCLVTATNDVGASSPAASNAVGTVIEPAPTNSAVPTLGGVNAQTNNTITSTTGTWTHMAGSNPTFTYQWQDSADGSTGWANVTGATSSSYKVAVGELNKFLRCAVTAHNTNSSTATADTVASAQVTAGVAVASGVRFSPRPNFFYLF